MSRHGFKPKSPVRTAMNSMVFLILSSTKPFKITPILLKYSYYVLHITCFTFNQPRSLAAALYQQLHSKSHVKWKKIHDNRKKKINIIPSQGLNLFSMSILSGQVMLFAVKQDQDKDRSSNSGTSWGLNHCFSIITQCIQAVNQHWYGLGTLLTLVYWSSSWSDMLTNIDLFQFLTLLRLLEQQPWKKNI